MKRRNHCLLVSGEMCSWHCPLCWRDDFFIMLTPDQTVPSTLAMLSPAVREAAMMELLGWAQSLHHVSLAHLGSTEQALSIRDSHVSERNGVMLRASGHLGGHADLWQVACVLHNIYVKHVYLPNDDKLLTLAKQAWYSFGGLLLRKINTPVIAQRDKKDRWQFFIDKRFCLYFKRIYFLPLYWYSHELRQRYTIFHVFVRMCYYYGWWWLHCFI